MLKRSCEVDAKACIFCHKRLKDEYLRTATDHCKTVVHDAMNMRNKFSGLENRETITRLQEVMDNRDVSILWHVKCYSLSPVREKTRAHVQQVDWDKCVFCQVHTNERVSAVMTFGMSEQIQEIAKLDYKMCTQLAGASDLIAAEAKYHLSWFRASKKSKDKTTGELKDNDLALIWLLKEIEHAAHKGCVIKVENAWDRYIVLAEDAGITIPSSFISRPATFKEKLMSIVGHIMECVKSLEKGPSERHTLLIPKKYAKLALSQLVHQTAQANDEEDDKLTLPVYNQQDDIFLSIVHVALKIRSDLQDTPGYTGLDIVEHDADNCVPESLQLFLNLLFGGEQLGRKWTPKHIGLGSTLHQVTTSKDLVKLFHKAGHILSYDQILQVDTGLAESVLNTLDEETGAVIPPNLVQGSFIHFCG